MKTAYNIAGEPKSLPNCPVCKNGEIWVEEDFVMADADSPLHSQRICGECNTKYMFNNRVGELTPTFAELMASQLLVQAIGGSKVEGKKLIELRKAYEDTGTCLMHDWIPSNRARTAEGEFVFNTCSICKTGRVTRNGVTYEDQIMKLVSWVAHKGIEARHTQDLMDSLGIKKELSPVVEFL